MRKLITIIILSLCAVSCAKKKETGKMELQNIESDGSINYRGLFHEEIEKERAEEAKSREEYFRK